MYQFKHLLDYTYVTVFILFTEIVSKVIFKLVYFALFTFYYLLFEGIQTL